MAVTKALPFIARKDSATAQPFAEMAASHESHKSGIRDNKHALDITVLGMCSGAALDGLSCAFLRYKQEGSDEPLRMSILKHEETVVPLQLRTPILNLLRDHPKNPNALSRVHSMLGYMYSKSAKCFCNNHGISIESIHLIASRADSIPPSVAPPLSPAQSTNEDEPAFKSWTAVVAAETGVTTALNLPATRRPANIQDPNAAPPVDSLLLQHPTKFRVCITINELLLISIIPPAESEVLTPPPSSVCGPGTMFIDYAMRYATSNRIHNDYDGTYSSRGVVNHNVVERFLEANDYSARVPPFHIATEMFGHHEAQGVIDECLFLGMTDYDTVATVTRITAENIVRQYRRLVAKHCPRDQKIDEIFICGPGARDTDIVDYMEAVLPEEVITRPLDDIGIPGDAKEAICCAQLGLEMVLKFAAKEDGPFEREHQNRVMGGVVKGKRWDELREHIMRFSEGKEMPPVQRIVVEKK